MNTYVEEMRFATSFVPISSEPQPLDRKVVLIDGSATRVGDVLIWKRYDEVVGIIAHLPGRDDRKTMIQYARAVASQGRVRSSEANTQDRANVARLPRLIERVTQILAQHGPSRTSGELGFGFWTDRSGRIRFVPFASLSVVIDSL